MFWCLVRLSTGALCGGLYASPLEMAIQSAVACSEAKDDGLLVSCQLMERVLVGLYPSVLQWKTAFFLLWIRVLLSMFGPPLHRGMCGGLYASPLEMAIQSAVACSEAKDDGLLVSCQLMERDLVWVVSFSLAVDKSFAVEMKDGCIRLDKAGILQTSSVHTMI